MQVGGGMSGTIEVGSAVERGKPVSAKVVAEYILTLANPDEGDLVSHLKLQKLLYYCQGFHLALHGKPLFTEAIQHWEHGPVVEAIYHSYKQFGSEALKPDPNADLSSLSQAQKETIDEVYDVYGQFSAWKLRQMTHAEEPWKSTSQGEEITHESLKEFFKKRIAS